MILYRHDDTGGMCDRLIRVGRWGNYDARRSGGRRGASRVTFRSRYGSVLYSCSRRRAVRKRIVSRRVRHSGQSDPQGRRPTRGVRHE